ncbi:MAG: methionine synthase [Chloroflexota bacterium]|nr:methionine synthase [Chloroflexota bacterium]
MPSTTKHSAYLAALAERVLIYDGAMGTSLDLYPLTVEDFGGQRTEGNRDYLAYTRPDIIREIHASHMAAGADVLETNTFQSTRMRLEEWGLADRTHELNLNAARLARLVADEYEAKDGRKRFVAGSMGPTGKLPSSDDPALSDVTFDQLSDTFCEQAVALIEGGVDVLLVETSVDILEVKAALDGIRRAKQQLKREDIAVQAQVFWDVAGRMLLGTDAPAVIATLEAMPVDVIGLNCSTGPEHMRDTIRFLCQHSRLPISCIPNAGLPIEVNGETVFPLEPEPFAQTLSEFATQYGVAVVGGCCGTRPAHIARLREVVGYDRRPLQRAIEYAPSVSSGITAVPLQQEPAPLMIGERVNTLGSRKVKRLLLNDDYDGVVEVAREQLDSGAHVLDVGVAMTERSDEKEQMVKLVKKLTMNIELPLVIDTTEADVLDATLAMYPGRAIVNSVSLEGGRGDKIDRTMPLVARYGAATVAMTIDEEGMAHTVERKLEIAQRIARIANDEFGVPNEALIFDVLTFPITTGQEELKRAGVETIEGIRAVKQHIPGCFTTLGVSNLSFGVAPHARGALNSVFLYHAVKAGLDSAIINPAHVTPYADVPAEQRQICEDLIFNRRDDALARFIQFYENTVAAEKDERSDPTEGLTVEQRIHWKIVHRKKEAIDADIDTALAARMEDGTARGVAAVAILNDVLLPAMKEVGDKFGAGELILPFVLQSAEVMKKAVGHLEQYLDKQAGATKGKVVLATVYGDVHDIGKNLVNTILSNNGYTVYDLGKQVPLNTIIEKAIEVNADAIGLSALLVSTSKQMPLCVQELQRRGLKFPVIVGGAAINRQYGQRILFVEGKPYESGVFYCKDAFEGLETVDKLVDPKTHDSFVDEIIHSAYKGLEEPERGRTVLEKLGKGPHDGIVRSHVRADIAIPTPPFWGAKTTTRIRLDDVWQHMDLNTLFRLQWGAKNAKGDDYKRLLETEFMPRLRDLQRDAKEQGWLQPAVAYGYFPVQSAGNDLIVYEPTLWASGKGELKPEYLRELTRFAFPRQPERERLCLADYFASVDSGRMDVAAFQVVTLGKVASDYVDALQAAHDYSRSYFVHGLSVTATEGLAEYTNQIVRQGLGLTGDAKRGKRYSWGYPAIPDLDQHAQVWRLLPAAELGITLTESFQIVPEQSTAAIVVHHPQATYFSIGGSTRERAQEDIAGVVG